MKQDIIKHHLKKSLFITHTEKFIHQHEHNIIERFVAKHPTLKPQIILMNDEAHGFKKLPRATRQLENFPIYAEIDYCIEANEIYIEQFSLYTEFAIKDNITIEEIKEAIDPYSATLALEYTQRYEEDAIKKSVVLHSKLFDRLLEDNLILNDEETILDKLEIDMVMDIHINCLLKSIEKVAAITKVKRIAKLEEIIKNS